jgi:hypothetical protein
VATRRALVLTAALVWLVCICPLRALAYGVYEWEIGVDDRDAPELFSEAFITPPPGPDDEGLIALEGYFDADDGDLADMYCIYIGGAPPNLGTPYHRFTPEQFTVTFVQPYASQGSDPQPQIADPQLFLFDTQGHAVVGNDDTSAINFQSTIPLGTITESGFYILAVTGTGYNPTDADMNEMFTNNTTGLKTPTNASAVQADWTGTHDQDGYYRLRFGTGTDGEPDRIAGAEHCVPEPNTFALLLLGLGVLTRWRKRV